AGPNFPYCWVMPDALTYTPEHGEPQVKVTTVPFTTDFASIPWAVTWLIPRYGLYTKATIVHDYLCRTQRDKFSSDRTFRLAMKDLGVSRVTRTLMWAAVTIATIAGVALLRRRWLGWPVLAAVGVLSGVVLVPHLGTLVGTLVGVAVL